METNISILTKVFLAVIIVGCFSCKGSLLQPATTQTVLLYPYLDSSGLYGYADSTGSLVIQPAYKEAGKFSDRGYAVVAIGSNKMGVIDQQNQVIIPFEYEQVHIYELDNYTVASLSKTYINKWRFWDWKFLPGLNLLGGGSRDNRLFDTRVKRKKQSVVILGSSVKQIMSRRVNGKYSSSYFDVRALTDNRLLIEGVLYKIAAKGAKRLAQVKMIPERMDQFFNTYENKLYLLDSMGKRVDKDGFTRLSSIEFKINNNVHTLELGLERRNQIAKAYKNKHGQVFIFPDFEKALPLRLQDNLKDTALNAIDVLQQAYMLYPVPNQPYFFWMGKDSSRQPFFKFLDTAGRWHNDLPDNNGFTVNRGDNSILWPRSEYYISKDDLPQGWHVSLIYPLWDEDLYEVRIRKDSISKEGIWNLKDKKWLIQPKYESVNRVEDHYWRFQKDKEGLWGVLDNQGKELIQPKYFFIDSEGWTQLKLKKGYATFYLHLPTLKEFRTKEVE